ncbi:MAG: sodium/proton antiporter [Pantoea sp. Brub]|nr:sodium/proton antiporter [Pantoea sp. Brub]
MITDHNRTIQEFFLGRSPVWYKLIIIIFLLVNPIIYFFIDQFFSSWILIFEFVFILAMSLKCYPLFSSGLLIFEAICMGMVDTEQIKVEIYNNFEIILLLIFMVTGIFFIKELLIFIFIRLILHINSKLKLGLVLCLITSFLSAFIDALTVLTVIIIVFISLYNIYNQIIHDAKCKKYIDNRKISLNQFRCFLCNLIMYACIGTTLGGVMTMVGEPQNIIIAHNVGWNFKSFFLHMYPITIPIVISGICTIIILEKFKIFGYGITIPNVVYKLIKIAYYKKYVTSNQQSILKLFIQGMILIWLIFAIIFRIMDIGLLGLFVIILSTSLCGIVDENKIGRAFGEILPFVSLLVIFFAINAIIIKQNLFSPIIHFILNSSQNKQFTWLYIFNGLLSSIADNVFAGSMYIHEIKHAFEQKLINYHTFESLAVITNIGTNIPSVATPNGQAAFLFLLTSKLAPMISLSYRRMVWMALPFTIILSLVGYVSIIFNID